MFRKAVSYSGCFDTNVCVSPQFMHWNLTLSMAILGGRASGSWLGHEGGAHMNEVNAIIKKTPEHVRYKDAGSAGALILDFPVPRTMMNKCLLFVSYPTYGIFWYFF